MTKTITIPLREPIAFDGVEYAKLTVRNPSDAELAAYLARVRDGARNVPFPAIGLPLNLVCAMNRGDFGKMVDAMREVAPGFLLDTQRANGDAAPAAVLN